MDFSQSPALCALRCYSPRVPARSADESRGTPDVRYGRETDGTFATPEQDDLPSPPALSPFFGGRPHLFWRQSPLALALPAPSAGRIFWIAVLLLGTAAYFYLSYREKKIASRNPDPWANPQTLDSLLILALDQHTAFRMSSLEGQTPPLSGHCVHLDGQRLLLKPDLAPLSETSAGQLPAPMPGQSLSPVSSPLSSKMAGQAPSPSAFFLPGKAVRLDFCVTSSGTPRTFRFDSRILREHADREGTILELARPTRLERWQRRNFERIAPPRPDVLAIGVWPWNPQEWTLRNGDSQENLLPRDPAALPAPLLVFRPDKAENVRLANISASGLALRVRKKTLAALLDAAAPSSGVRTQDARTNGKLWGSKLPGCLIFLSLREKESPPVSLWLACQRRHATSCVSRPASLILGFQIAHWAETTDANAPMHWKPAASGGETPPLLRWTMRRTGNTHNL